MNSNTRLSVIIPIYNAENYLSILLESLVKTTGISDAEILLIDDGSADNSGKIADQYADQYEFITCYHIPSSGPSYARNYGLQNATGYYVCFFDADDEVVSDEFSKIISLVETLDVDILLWDAGVIGNDDFPTKWKDKSFFNHCGLEANDVISSGKQVVEKQLIVRGDYPATVWLGAYRKEYLISNNLLFEVGLIHEDELWGHKVLLSAERVKYVDAKVYLYRIHSGSLTHKLDNDYSKHIEALLYIFPSLYSFCDDELMNPLKRLVKSNLTKRYLYLIYEYDFCKNGYGDRIDFRSIWKNAGRIKDRIKIILLKIKCVQFRIFKRTC